MSKGLSLMATLAVCAMVAAPANAGLTKTVIGGDIIWEDDFLRPGGGEFLDQQRNEEYCIYGTAPRPDYTGLDVLLAGGYNSTSMTIANGQIGVNHIEYLTGFGAVQIPFAILGWQNNVANCTGGSPVGEHDTEFDSDDVCMYAGMRFNAWHLKFSPDHGPWGPDAVPGYAGVDDDGDGTTDYNKGPGGGPAYTAIGGNDGDFPDNNTPDEMSVSGTYDGTIGTSEEFPSVEEYDIRVTKTGPYPANGIDDDANGTTDDEAPWEASVRRIGDNSFPFETNGLDDDADGATDEALERSGIFTSGVPKALDGRGLSITFTNTLPGRVGVDDDGDGVTDELLEDGQTANGDGEWDIDVWVAQATVTTHRASFTNELYGYNLAFNSGNPGYVSPHGPDGKAGVAGVDDDGNGVTDEFPTIGRPGTDDDSDGTTDEAAEVVLDELGERNLGDDADDELGRGAQSFLINSETGSGSGIFLNVDPGSGGGNLFSIRHFLFFGESGLESTDEIAPGFYEAEKEYGFVWCVSGSCYGAQMWVGNDAGNPVETLGPLVNSDHGGPGAHETAIGASQFGSGVVALLERWPLLTNQLYDDKFWAIEGSHSPTVTVLQDRDRDGDVDGVDFAVFASCFNKAGNPPRTAGCTADDAAGMDADNDGDVDGVDFAVFASCFNKAGNPPRAPGCYPEASSLTACGS